MNSLHLHVGEQSPVSLSAGPPRRVPLSVGAEVYGPPPYGGPLTVVPSQSEQVLGTAGTMLLQDIKVEPIPSNFGIITWDGSTITVS